MSCHLMITLNILDRTFSCTQRSPPNLKTWTQNNISIQSRQERLASWLTIAQSKVLENLRALQGAPGVQMQQVPPDIAFMEDEEEPVRFATCFRWFL
jgi:hypothetical protein